MASPRPLNFGVMHKEESMSGWMRLWVLIAAIWAVIVIGITTVVVVDTFDDTDGPWVMYSLSDNAKPFFENLESDENGPAYTVDFSYTDGSKQSVRFPLLESEALVGFDQKINNLAKKEGKSIAEDEIRRFLDAIAKKNSEAKSALAEYQQEVENITNRKVGERKQAIGVGVLVTVIPPVVLLLLGYGVAWVRRGFA